MRGVPPRLVRLLAIRKSVGLFIGENEITMCRAGLSPLGIVELATETVPLRPENLGDVLEQLLPRDTRSSRRNRLRVAIGIPAMRAFFATRPSQSNERDASPVMLLHGVLKTSDMNADEMHVDVRSTKVGTRALVSLVACRRKYLQSLLEALDHCGVRPYRVEPAPFALLRLAASRHPVPRNCQTVIRMVLGDKQGLALLTQGTTALACRSFELPPGEEAGAIRSTAFAMRLVGRHCGTENGPDALLIHGRLDLADIVQGEDVAGVLGYRVFHWAGPSYDPNSIALGLALGCRETEDGFDLSRSLKPRPPLREVIPFAQIAAQSAVLASFSWMLNGHLGDVRQQLQMIQAECSGHSWIRKVSDDGLSKEKTDLEQKIAAVKGYLETRVLWSTYTRDAASRMTENMVLRSFNGIAELPGGSKKTSGPKKLLTLGLTAPIPQGDTMPPEIDAYLDVLRSDEVLRRDFPQIELGGLRWAQGRSGSQGPQASFTVNCLPKADKPATKAAPPAAAK